MSNKIITNAISAVLAMGLTSFTAQAETVPSPMQMGAVNGMEKCYGIAKAGQNDCGTASHGCAGESTADGNKAAWMFVPTGVCKKIVGGNITSG